jgi:hypothetical protein
VQEELNPSRLCVESQPKNTQKNTQIATLGQNALKEINFLVIAARVSLKMRQEISHGRTLAPSIHLPIKLER